MSQTTMSAPLTDPARLLRIALWANAVFCALAAFLMIMQAPRLAEQIAIAPTWLITGAGFGLLGFAFATAMLARKPVINTSEGIAMVLADAMWVAGSVIALLAHGTEMTSTGQWLVGIVAIIVLGFAGAEYIGTRQIAKR